MEGSGGAYDLIAFVAWELEVMGVDNNNNSQVAIAST